MELPQHILDRIVRRLDYLEKRQELVLTRLDVLKGKVSEMAKTLDEVLAAVAAEDTKVDSLIALVTGLKQQLLDALAGVTLPPAVQAKIDEVFDKVTTQATKVQGALDANVPPTP